MAQPPCCRYHPRTSGLYRSLRRSIDESVEHLQRRLNFDEEPSLYSLAASPHRARAASPSLYPPSPPPRAASPGPLSPGRQRLSPARYDSSADAKLGKHLSSFTTLEVCDLLQDMGFDHLDVNVIRMDRLTGGSPGRALCGAGAFLSQCLLACRVRCSIF